MQKLINNSEYCVDDSIRGLLSISHNLRVIEGSRVVVRSDVIDESGGSAIRKVAVIGGGGSGHEPAFAGYVGNGFLSAAVCGDVFTSPNPNQIIAALNACRRPAGILVVVFNYTGDRLNFAIAVERFKAQKNRCPIKMVFVADDCALTDMKDRSAGRRGLAGGIIVQKIVCGAAESGLGLDQVSKLSDTLVASMRTIGISLSSCCLPGRGPIFELPPDEMELGLGVHGEPGVARIKTATAEAVVDRMFKHMTDTNSATSFTLSAGEAVVVAVNNLGGMSQIEMNIVAKEAMDWLNSRKVNVRRYISGPLMTSLEMRGVSISVLKVADPRWLEYLDSPVDCLAWPVMTNVRGGGHPLPTASFGFSPEKIIPTVKETDEMTNVSGADSGSLSEESASIVQSAIEAACKALVNKHQELDDLDALCGDGDCGATMKRGAEAILLALPSYNLKHPQVLLQQLASTWQMRTGGTSGAIYSLFFTSAANALSDSADACAWLTSLIAGTETVIKHSGANAGDRTLVDVLYPASELAKEITRNRKVVERNDLKRFEQVIKKAAENTASMKARAGRASYVASEHLRSPDPGAMGCYYWMAAVISVILGHT